MTIRGILSVVHAEACTCHSNQMTAAGRHFGCRVSGKPYGRRCVRHETHPFTDPRCSALREQIAQDIPHADDLVGLLASRVKVLAEERRLQGARP